MGLVWTWASFDGDRFGTGVVLCRNAATVRVWLPVKTGWKEPLDQFLESKELSASKDGAASKAAGKLEKAFLKGQDTSTLVIGWLNPMPEFLGRVYEACRSIPKGQTRSYGELAAQAGNPAAARAAGNAMQRNPLPIVVPCHRVLRTGGSLGNYGGGLEMKRWLLEREGALTH